jgi:peptidoglycan/LPS O-acetylase OafA/YrhL
MKMTSKAPFDLRMRSALTNFPVAWRQATPIAAYATEYDNNFNLIRLIAAAMVIFGHSYVLTLQRGYREPMSALTGMEPGPFAVNVFFVISGFLITKSYLNRNKVSTYLVARSLRIFPGLFVAMLFNVLVVGVVFTSLPLWHYVRDQDTWQYILINSTLISRFVQLEYDLPGVFATNPFGAAVNGSLWTLPYEVWIYIALLMAGIVGILRSRKAVNFLFIGFLIVNTAIALGLLHNPFSMLANFVRFATFFGWGVVFYTNRFSIPLSGFIAAPLLIIAVLGWRTPLSDPVLFPLALSYAILWLAYIPKGAIRQYNKLGDYSYGVYIYAWPVQQGAVALFPNILPLQLFGIALPITLFLAVLSWHLVEKPALRAKSRLSALKLPNKATKPQVMSDQREST